MAIWQFTLHFLPKEKVITYFGEIPSFLSFNDYYDADENLDISSPIQSELETYLDYFLKLSCGFERIKSWSNSLIIWGEDKGNEVNLFTADTANLYHLYAEVDLRNFRADFVDSLVEIAQKLDCILYTKNHTVISPTRGLLIEEIKQSRAYKFCVDPYGYLEQLGSTLDE